MATIYNFDGMQFTLKKLEKMPNGGPRSMPGTGKWEWLRQAAKDMTPEDEPFGLVCPNKHEAECARTALNNMCREGKGHGNAATKLANPNWIIRTVVAQANGNPDGQYLLSFCVVER